VLCFYLIAALICLLYTSPAKMRIKHSVGDKTEVPVCLLAHAVWLWTPEVGSLGCVIEF
jgi:hypothetical protein